MHDTKLKLREKEKDTEVSTPSWFDRVRKDVERFDLPVPDELETQEEIEERLGRIEQDDGE
jgi:hypothetical protein